MSHDILDWIARETGARDVRRRERIQTLWGGVGELFRVELVGAAAETAIVKWARGRVDEADDMKVDAALAWLASFHARFIGARVPQLWSTGTYWHLATRLDELPAIEDRQLREAAPAIAERLAAARFQTIVHGDPKEANFCFGPTSVAAVDFQYTGRACAMTDVAYLLYGRRDEPQDGIDRKRLATYFTELRARLPPDVDGTALEAEWRALYPYARLDFCRFLAGWRPSMWAHDRRGQAFVRACVERGVC